MNTDFSNGAFMYEYYIFCNFQKSCNVHILGLDDFKNFAPVLVFDANKEDNRLWVLKFLLQTTEVPSGTQAYALILHDHMDTYNVRDKVA
ncbi:hypothetical protein PR048_016561 [Dryococelus australis]|uniref:MULE transposase domain-containing protein n=1 Tax=Dryococelus australis TaxID=614101 RepID=A0ABQ9HK45_9NEOP|nr:hypothetical protein PR048_016561 [Dryococelus australis]